MEDLAPQGIPATDTGWMVAADRVFAPKSGWPAHCVLIKHFHRHSFYFFFRCGVLGVFLMWERFPRLVTGWLFGVSLCPKTDTYLLKPFPKVELLYLKRGAPIKGACLAADEGLVGLIRKLPCKWRAVHFLLPFKLVQR